MPIPSQVLVLWNQLVGFGGSDRQSYQARSRLEGMYEANSNLQKDNTQGIHGYSPKFGRPAPKVYIDVHRSSGGQLTPLCPLMDLPVVMEKGDREGEWSGLRWLVKERKGQYWNNKNQGGEKIWFELDSAQNLSQEYRGGPLGCVWYVGRDGTERDEAFRPAFGASKMGGTGCSTGQILSVFAFHLPPWNGFVPRLWNAMFYHFKTNIPYVFFKNYTFVPSRPVPFRPVPSRSVPFRLRTKRTLNALEHCTN
ncbi:hypothetical protein DVH24_001132 [Malus domestica]|uniref:Uncharacterized protein n=1 Tax=Malus domestica TaxID=3750 RepID=A0A498K0T4_MALDO|nr:hypothetical protein DVH24_001132 [Malus domestica]